MTKNVLIHIFTDDYGILNVFFLGGEDTEFQKRQWIFFKRDNIQS